jgi:glycosyltransferase involved in cell wall biosynthesis
MSASRNLGLRHARGRYITFLDADDVFFPRALERMVSLLAGHPEAGAVRGLCQLWHGWTGKPEDLRRDRVPPLRLCPNTLYHPPRLLTLTSPLGRAASPGVAGLLVRREVVERIGGFDEAFRGLGEDQIFYWKLYLNEAVYVTDEPWFKYRQHPDSCCAVAERTGDYSSLSLAWDWLNDYLVREGVKDPEVWNALGGWRFSLYRHPAAYRLVKRLARMTWLAPVCRWLPALAGKVREPLAGRARKAAPCA